MQFAGIFSASMPETQVLTFSLELRAEINTHTSTRGCVMRINEHINEPDMAADVNSYISTHELQNQHQMNM